MLSTSHMVTKIITAAVVLIVLVVQLAAAKSIKNPVNQAKDLFNDERLGPVIFIPGDGGSQMEAKLNKTSRVHYICDETSDWYDIWLNIHTLVPVEFDCFSDNFRLEYNRTTRKTSNADGVEIRPTTRWYGSLASVVYLDINNYSNTAYFENIAAALEKVYHFKRNDDMNGAPYDFRRAPNELDEFFADLTYQIEAQYVFHNYKPVTLICHSMGCLNALYLLNRQTQNWKDVFVGRLIALAAPWHGSFKAISTMMFGDDLGIPVVFHYGRDKLQALQKTFPSLMYLFPRAPTFNENQVLVQTPDANYTLKNLDKLFEYTNLTDQREMWHDTRTIAASLSAPNVELWCLYGNQPNSTPSKLILDKPYSAFSYIEEMGPGDGTVNLESLRACESFASQQEKPVHTREFEDLDHVDILRDPKVSNFITTYILNSSMDWTRLTTND